MHAVVDVGVDVVVDVVVNVGVGKSVDVGVDVGVGKSVSIGSRRLSMSMSMSISISISVGSSRVNDVVVQKRMMVDGGVMRVRAVEVQAHGNVKVSIHTGIHVGGHVCRG